MKATTSLNKAPHLEFLPPPRGYKAPRATVGAPQYVVYCGNNRIGLITHYDYDDPSFGEGKRSNVWSLYCRGFTVKPFDRDIIDWGKASSSLDALRRFQEKWTSFCVNLSALNLVVVKHQKVQEKSQAVLG